MLTVQGRLHQCGLPDKPLPEFSAAAMSSNGCSLSVSHIGSKKEANAMLKLAAEKGVRTHSCTLGSTTTGIPCLGPGPLKTWKEVIPMKDVGKAVKDNKVRYRYVLKVDI